MPASVAVTHQDASKNWYPVVLPQVTATDGEDYQIDANALKGGVDTYIVGAMGDMLEDVNRASYRVEDGNTGTGATPIVDILGAADGTTFFASPWGKGGNVTDFCYKAGSRTTTVATATGTANGCDAGGGGTAGQCTSGSVVV